MRDGGKVRQRIVRHIGVAMDEDELERLRRLGEYVKAKLTDERQPALFAPEKIAEQVIRVGRRGDGKQELPVDLKQLVEEQRLVTGVHEVYGEMYRLLGLDALLPRSRYRASHDALFHVVMARIANPDSKRGSVRRLEEDFGVSLPLEKVYRMMDRLDAKAIAHLRTRVGEASRALLPEPVAVLFFDCTTLAFETAVEDALRQHGFSKDGKHRDAQVLLALMVSREGLPVSYEVLPGATYEGSLLPVHADSLLAAQGIRMNLGHAMNMFLDSWDLLLTPQVPIPAFETNAEVPAGRGMKSWMEWSPFTYPFNFTGHPAATVPCGLTPDGLPAAIQLVGPRYREDLVLRAARAYETAHPFVMPPLPSV